MESEVNIKHSFGNVSPASDILSPMEKKDQFFSADVTHIKMANFENNMECESSEISAKNNSLVAIPCMDTMDIPEK